MNQHVLFTLFTYFQTASKLLTYQDVHLLFQIRFFIFMCRETLCACVCAALGPRRSIMAADLRLLTLYLHLISYSRAIDIYEIGHALFKVCVDNVHARSFTFSNTPKFVRCVSSKCMTVKRLAVVSMSRQPHTVVRTRRREVLPDRRRVTFVVTPFADIVHAHVHVSLRMSCESQRSIGVL
ncbi:hypothetical protein K504DRAFT_182276 [Pleomassaria siparia CBS 279.74]|uniref:Uncharacterized protein n=1 Tax=Pleomassaria siparia CBS 279.74 TaxID=1314801 RepID=A0A6G1JRT2_9PLEO|nr:hypothetical protein K504DRAFT_182276 [Pleomassaria siparia CBS 279.74]